MPSHHAARSDRVEPATSQTLNQRTVGKQLKNAEIDVTSKKNSACIIPFYSTNSACIASKQFLIHILSLDPAVDKLLAVYVGLDGTDRESAGMLAGPYGPELKLHALTRSVAMWFLS